MWFRKSSGVGLIALATFVATFALPFVDSRHGLGGDADLGWGDDRIGLGHPVTQVEPVYPSRADGHCALCHWARAFSSSVTNDVVRHLPPAITSAVVAIESAPAAAVFAVAGPPRGPPVFL